MKVIFIGPLQGANILIFKLKNCLKIIFHEKLNFVVVMRIST